MAMEEEEGCLLDWDSDSAEWNWDSDLEENVNHSDSLAPAIFQGGCRDRDCPDRLSPIFQVRKDKGMASIRNLEVSGREKTGSSIKNLVVSEEAVTEAARCTGAGAASARLTSGSDVYSVFTAVPLSPHYIVSSDHVRFITEGLLAQNYLLTLVDRPPWKHDKISCLNLLNPVVVSSVDDDKMIDPTNGTPCLFKNILADFNFWKLAPGKRTHNQRFERFLFPASISFFWDSTRTCALVMYPDVDTFRDDLEMMKNKQQEALQEQDALKRKGLMKDLRLFQEKFWEMNSGMVLAELRSRELSGDESDLKKLKNELFKKMYRLRRDTWQRGSSGDCFVGVGHLIDYNRTTIAHSVSTLPGASGSALVPTGVKTRVIEGGSGDATLVPSEVRTIKRIICGVHSGFSESACSPLFDHPFFKVRRPDHNIALSCDHPAFVTQYWRLIVDDLPPPSKYSSRELDETLMPFVHWIGLHLRLIVCSVKEGQWSSSQKCWLTFAVKHWLAEINYMKPDFRKLVRKIRETPRMLHQMVTMGFPAGAETEEQIRFVQALQDNRFAVQLEAWNMPGVCCKSSLDLARIATSLFADLLAEDQQYLKVPLQEFDHCRLVQSGIQVSRMRVEILVRAFALGFRSVFISSDRAEETLRDALRLSHIKREYVQVLTGAWTTTDDLKKRINTMGCEFVDVLVVKLLDLRASNEELQALVDSRLVKCIGLRTDSVSEVTEALNWFPLGLVQVDVSNGVVPIDIAGKCSALNIGLVSTSDLWDMERNNEDDNHAKLDATLAQLNVVWRIKNSVVPFTEVESGEELSKLRDVAIQHRRFSMMID